jgi:hypothetical protein
VYSGLTVDGDFVEWSLEFLEWSGTLQTIQSQGYVDRKWFINFTEMHDVIETRSSGKK